MGCYFGDEGVSIEIMNYRVLKGGVQGEEVFLGNPEDSGREDWGTLGNIRDD